MDVVHVTLVVELSTPGDVTAGVVIEAVQPVGIAEALDGTATSRDSVRARVDRRAAAMPRRRRRAGVCGVMPPSVLGTSYTYVSFGPATSGSSRRPR